MQALTLKRLSGTEGAWLVCHGRTRLALIVMPIADAVPGFQPSKHAVIEAVQEHAPHYGATMQTPVLTEMD